MAEPRTAMTMATTCTSDEKSVDFLLSTQGLERWLSET